MEKPLFILLLLPAIQAAIVIDVSIGEKNDTKITYTGTEESIFESEDLKLFQMDNKAVSDAIAVKFCSKPTNFYFKSPTPFNDLYKTNNWEQVSRNVVVESAKIKSLKSKLVQVMKQDFENRSDKTVKVNTGISQTVSNSIATSWAKETEAGVSQEFKYGANVIFASIEGNTGFSYKTVWGKAEEKSMSTTIGSTSNIETELKPNQAVTAILNAKKGSLEIEVVYLATLKGGVAINFKRRCRGHHFWKWSIKEIMKQADVKNSAKVIGTIKLDIYMDASVIIYDKKTGLPL